MLNHKVYVSFAMAIILWPSWNNMQGIHGDANPRKHDVEMLTLLKESDIERQIKVAICMSLVKTLVWFETF